MLITPHSTSRCLLLEVITPHYHREHAIENFSELESLVRTFGGLVVERTVQHRVKPHPATYIGSGKIEQVKKSVQDLQIDTVILNSIVNAGQIFRLEKELWGVNPKIRVWDRADLILQIFQKHAASTEAKLQIELAQLQHLGPRIYGLGGTVFSRQAGGIGARGIGETNIELMRRHIKERIRVIRQNLEKVARQRVQAIEGRKTQGARTVALTGYTNAGKTSLFNRLTGKEKSVENSLFTTLDSIVGKLLGSQKQVLVSDTIGFIDQLPTFLIEAFRSTLMESVQADLLLHVVDVSDEYMDRKIAIVEEILNQLQLEEKREIIVFNKTDKITSEKQKTIQFAYQKNAYIFISVKTGFGIDQLLQLIDRTFPFILNDILR